MSQHHVAKGKTRPPDRQLSYVENPRITFQRNFLRLLKMWCATTGLSMNEFGRRIGVCSAQLHYYKTGERAPSFDALGRMAEVMGVPVEMFFRR